MKKNASAPSSAKLPTRASESHSYWLVKSEPDVYSWDDLVRDGETFWDGVRNFQARNNLRAMRTGDLALYYHSNIGKEVVGIVRISREAYPDPTVDPNDSAEQKGAWVVVDVRPHKALATPVTLEAMKAAPELAQMGLIRQSRLSVVPLTAEEFAFVCACGGVSMKGMQ
jgi:predicted RNA-binding protein with PUA-like domain